MRTGGQTYYLFPDHLGSTHVTANSSGAQVGRLLYRPWGEARSIEGTPQTNWRFAGQREDATIGLYFYNARYYDPVLGRFTQPDTIVPDPGDPQALNRYSYVLNNPVLYIDPSGHAYDAGGAAGPSCSDGSASYLACTYPPSHPLAGYWIGVPRRRNANANWGSCHTQTCSPRRAHDPAVHNPKHSAASLH